MEYFADIGRLSSGNSGKGWSSLSKAVKPKINVEVILVVFVLMLEILTLRMILLPC